VCIEGDASIAKPRRPYAGGALLYALQDAGSRLKAHQMADYFPLISRAVAGLAKNESENRRALYDRARVALVAQLREITPALSDLDIIREQADLEKAIRRVESLHAAQSKAKVGTVTPIAPMPRLFPHSTD
jgi:hypothetical protein